MLDSEHWEQDQEQHRDKGAVRQRKLKILLDQRALPCSNKNNINDEHIMNTVSMEHYFA